MVYFGNIHVNPFATTDIRLPGITSCGLITLLGGDLGAAFPSDKLKRAADHSGLPEGKGAKGRAPRQRGSGISTSTSLHGWSWASFSPWSGWAHVCGPPRSECRPGQPALRCHGDGLWHGAPILLRVQQGKRRQNRCDHGIEGACCDGEEAGCVDGYEVIGLVIWRT
jgi:hypothetical protein